MPVSQEQPQILSDLSLELFIYRILLLSPFEIRRKHEIVTTWRVKLYMYTFLIAYVTLRLFICIILVENKEILDQLFLFNGKLWMLIEIFDFAISAFLFGGIVTSGLITNNHQVKFYQDLHDFDVKLIADFGVSISRSRVRRINKWALIVSLVYNVGDIINVWISFIPTILTMFEKFAYFFTYYISNIVGFITALQFVLCTQLCRERIAIIRQLLRNKNHSERLDNVLNLLLRIRNQIFLINKFMGFVLLIKLAHDFTLGTSILYMLFSSSYDEGISEFYHILWWFCETISGSLVMTLLTEMLLKDVSKIILR